MPTVRVTYEIDLPTDTEVTALVQRLQAQGPVFGETLIRYLIAEGIIQWRLIDADRNVVYQNRSPEETALVAWVREWMAVRHDGLPDFTWVAMDQSGDVNAFENRPKVGGSFWVQGGNVQYLGRYWANPGVDWKTMCFALPKGD